MADAGPDTDVRAVFVTTPDGDVAERIVRALVEEGLAACGNIVPGIQSIYRWQGRIESSAELLIMLKTTAGSMPSVINRIREIHPYDVPEVVALPVTAGNPAYLEWVRSAGMD
jgi:periplasmic divalent cation tolerance protein